MYNNDTMGSLYICVNANSENFGRYTGVCCEDDCEDGERRCRVNILQKQKKRYKEK